MHEAISGVGAVPQAQHGKSAGRDSEIGGEIGMIIKHIAAHLYELANLYPIVSDLIESPYWSIEAKCKVQVRTISLSDVTLYVTDEQALIIANAILEKLEVA
jgi:hypothetical protein